METRLVKTACAPALFLLLILLALPGVGLAQPVLTAFSFTPTSIDTSNASANVTVNFTVTDTASPVYYFEMAFVDPSGVFVQRGIKSLTPGFSVTDSVVVTFPRFSAAGTPPTPWKVLAVYAADQAGNATYLDTAALLAAGRPTDLTVTSTPDTTPPAITAFSFTPSSIDTSTAAKQVTVNFTGTDDKTVASVYAGFVGPSGQITRGTRVSAPGDFAGGASVTSSLVIDFPRLSEGGVWKVSFINIVDGAGNSVFLDTAAVAAAGFPTDLTVTTLVDTTPPNLTSFSYSPGSLSTGGGTVNVNFTVTDDLSGANAFEIAFVSPSTAQVQRSSVSFGPSTPFTGSTSVTFPAGTEQGTWTVTTLVGDAAGNTSIATQASLTVTPPGADTTPPVIIPTVTPLPNGAGWNNTLPVTVTWSVTDPESSIASKTGCDPTTFNSPTTGTTLTCSATNTATPPLTSSASVTVKIDTAPPITTNTLATPNPIVINTDVTITATITDAGGSNVAAAEFNVDGGPFDDLAAADGAFGGSTENVSLTLPASATPLLQTTGIHTICVRGIDFADNVGATECVIFAIYDPNGGFATGGGAITSPTGADLDNPSLTGLATFGFVSKYLPGSTTPSGSLEFQFKDGNLNFKSSAMELLVVTGEPRAQFTGTGTINGTTVCKFDVDAWDGSFSPGPGQPSVDALGLKIRACDNGRDRYSVSPQPLIRGSIVIHQ